MEVRDLAFLGGRAIVVPTASLGEVSLATMKVKDILALAKARASDPFTPEGFISTVLKLLGSRSDGESLTDENIAELDPGERADLVQGLLKQLHYLYEKPTFEQSVGEDGVRVSKIAGYETVVPREDGESDDAYLLRAYEDHEQREAKRLKDMLNGVTGGLSETMKHLVKGDLAANVSASMRLKDQLKAMGLGPGGASDELRKMTEPSMRLRDSLRIEPGPAIMPKMAPHPALKTNQILAEVRTDIAEMRELAATQAEMQQSLNGVATTILTEFSKGAESSAKASKNALSTAKIGLYVAIASAVLTLAAIVVSVVQEGGRAKAEGQRQDRLEQLRSDELQGQREHTEALRRYAAALERQAQNPPPPASEKPSQSTVVRGQGNRSEAAPPQKR